MKLFGGIVLAVSTSVVFAENVNDESSVMTHEEAIVMTHDENSGVMDYDPELDITANNGTEFERMTRARATRKIEEIILL